MPRIPRVVHYIFAHDPAFKDKPWSLVHYVCVRSAVERICPDIVYFHCNQEPAGPWWDLTRPLVTLSHIEPPREVYGNPLLHPAHQSDVMRLDVLTHFGGIYLDIDVLVQRNFDDLLDHQTVMGLEGEDGVYGMANAVILAEPNAAFIRRWIEEYRWFRGQGRDSYWNEHSVEVPRRLARKHPEEITVLDERAFFWPTWTSADLRLLFEPQERDVRATYANHLWESHAWDRYLEYLTPGRVRAIDSAFHRWSKPFLLDLPDNMGAPSVGERLQRAKRLSSSSARRLTRGNLKRLAHWIFGPETAARIRAFLRGDKSVVSSVAARAFPAKFEAWHRRLVFQSTYRQRKWGSRQGAKFFSGEGSHGEAVNRYVERISALIEQRSRELGRNVTVVDLGCGDFTVGRQLLACVAGMDYIGCDIVPELIRYHIANTNDKRAVFRALDVVTDALPDGDICLIRQVFQHLSNADITSVLPKLARYETVIVSEGHPVILEGPANPDKRVGSNVRFDWENGRGRGIELDQAPFNRPVEEIFRVASTSTETVVTYLVDCRQVNSADVAFENSATSNPFDAGTTRLRRRS